MPTGRCRGVLTRKRDCHAFRHSFARSSRIASKSTRRSTVSRRSPSPSCARSASRCLSTSPRSAPSSSTRNEMTTTLALLQQAVSDTGYTYGHFPGIGGRGAVWIAAEVHLMFAAFVLGVPMFAVITELIGIVGKDEKYDKLSHEFTRLLVFAYSATALWGAMLLFSLTTLYPKF